LIDSDRLRASAPFLPAAIVIGGWLLWSHFEGGYFPAAWYPSAIAALALLAATAIGTGRLIPAPPLARLAIAALAGLVLWAFVSLLWSVSPGSGWDAANKLLLYLLVAWTLALLPWTRDSMRIALAAWVIGVVAVCAVSLIGATGAGPLGDYFIKGRYLDPIGYSNGVSALPLMALFPALWLCTRRGAGLPSRAGFLAAAVFLAQFSLLPQSRGAVIGFAVAILVFVAIVPERVRLILPLLVLAAAVAIAVGSIYDVYTVGIELSDAAEAGRTIPGLHLRAAVQDAGNAILLTSLGAGVAGVLLGLGSRSLSLREPELRKIRLGVAAVIGTVVVVALLVAAVNAGRISSDLSDRWHTFKSSEDTPATTGARLTANYSDQRYDYWRVAFEEFERKPLAGAGAGSFEAVYSAQRDYDKPSKYVHDIWLRVLAEGGLVGAALLALFLGAAIAGLTATWRRLEAQGRGLVATCAAVTVYFFVHGSFDWLDEFPALASPALALPLIGIVVEAQPISTPAAASRRLSRYAPAVAAGLLALTCAASLALPYLAERHLTRGAEIGLADVSVAREELDRAAALNPLSPEPHLRAATILVAAGDPAAAREEFREAIEVEDNWYAHFELALLEAQRGRHRAALAQMARAGALDRHDPFIADALAKIRRGGPIDAAAFNSDIRRFEAERFTRPKT
jgi:tetratricopeptide (TPR) repeat protein